MNTSLSIDLLIDQAIRKGFSSYESLDNKDKATFFAAYIDFLIHDSASKMFVKSSHLSGEDVFNIECSEVSDAIGDMSLLSWLPTLSKVLLSYGLDDQIDPKDCTEFAHAFINEFIPNFKPYVDDLFEEHMKLQGIPDDSEHLINDYQDRIKDIRAAL